MPTCGGHAWCSASGVQRQRRSLGRVPAASPASLESCFQDLKLNVLDWHLLPQLGILLVDMSLMLGATDLVDHYLRDLGPSAAGAASRKCEPNIARITWASPCSIAQLLSGASQPGAAACGVCWKMRRCLVT